MYFEYEDNKYLIVVKKKGFQNTYIRIKDDSIYITTSLLTTNKSIIKLIKDNQIKIEKMLFNYVKRKKDESKLFYLGATYDIIFTHNDDQMSFINDKVYVKNNESLNKFIHDNTKKILINRYYEIYNKIKLDIPQYKPRIRKMKSRWGVCNKKSQTITLNSNLIRYDLEVIDYVIIHELCHLVHFNHSSDFWNLVLQYCPDYKKMRNKLKE